MKRRTQAQAKKIPLHKREWPSLTPLQKSKRVKVFHVLSLMRKDDYTLAKAARLVGLCPSTVLTHAGPVIIKRAGNYIARASDKMQGRMLIKTNGHEIPVIITGSKARSVIGTYQSAVERYLATGDDSELAKFDGVTIKDNKGVEYDLETDPDKIKQIEESKEDRESYDLYDEE